ncbi:hypothetical protein JCM9279_000496 [Rhodotorula babjevae]
MHLSRLEQLPPELLSHLLAFLPLASLLALSSTSHRLHDFIARAHLAQYTARAMGARTPFSLQHLGFHRRAPWAQRALWAERTSARWDEWDGRGAVVSQWGGKCLPVLKLWEVDRGVGTVLVGKGRELELWATRGDGSVEVVPVVVPLPASGKGAAAAAAARGALDDVTSLASGTRAGEIVVGRHSGLVQRLRVAHHADVARGRPLVLEETARYAMTAAALGSSGGGGKAAGATAVQALHSEGGLLAAASTTRLPPPSASAAASATSASYGASPIHSLASSLSSRAAPKRHAVTLHSLSSPWQAPAVLPFAAKPWAVHLSPSRRYLAVGHTGLAPLSLFHLDSTGAPLSPDSPSILARTPRSTSVYGLTSPGPLSAFANPDETLLAAFYDSTARMYDLRVAPPPSSTSSAGGAWDAVDGDARPRNEVLRLSDPWSDDAAYALALGGAQGAILAVGSARNAAVRLFDLRSAAVPLPRCDGGAAELQLARERERTRGVTAFAPGRDRSPVYGLAGEASRFWGVTDRRGFVLDFDAFRARAASGGAEGERVAFVGHEEGGGGTLRWMGERA